MVITYQGKEYEMVLGSDLEKDGMFLELDDTSGNGNGVLLAFYSDIDHQFTFSANVKDLPLEVVELFIREARRRLVPLPEDEA